jgi:hypothetical protein
MTFHGGGWSGQSRPRTDCGRRDQAFLTRADLAVQSRRSYAQSLTELRSKSATTTCSSSLTPVGSLACSWERARRRPGTAMSRPPERGWWLTSWCASIVVANRRTARARSRTRSSSDCGGAMTSPCAKRRCGACSARPPLEPRRSSRSTSRHRPRQPPRGRTQQRWRHRPPALPDRIGATDPAADRRSVARPAVSHRSAPSTWSRTRARRRVPVNRRLSYRCAEEIFRAATSGWTLHHSAITHFARGQRRATDADGQEPPHEPAVAAEVRPTGPRRRRRAYRCARP